MAQTLQMFDLDFIPYQTQIRKQSIAYAANYVITYLLIFQLQKTYNDLFKSALQVKSHIQKIYKFADQQLKVISQKIKHLKTKYIDPVKSNLQKKQEQDITVSGNQGIKSLISIFAEDKQIKRFEKIILEELLFETRHQDQRSYLECYETVKKQIQDQKLKKIQKQKEEQEKQIQIQIQIQIQTQTAKQPKQSKQPKQVTQAKQTKQQGKNTETHVQQKPDQPKPNIIEHNIQHQQTTDEILAKVQEKVIYTLKSNKKQPPQDRSLIKKKILQAIQYKHIIDSIELYRPINQDKICCLDAVYNDSIILHDHPICGLRDQQNKIFIQGQITDKDNQEFFKKAICSLLNSDGGFIFFGLQKQFFSYKVVGQLLKQTDKDQKYQQKIVSWVREFISPLVTMSNKDQILVQFVPVVKLSDSFKAKIQNKEFQFQQGKYIVRIKVFSRGINAKNSYRFNNGQIQFYKYDDKNKKVEIVQNQQIYDMITSRYKGYNIYNNKLENTNKNIAKIHCHLGQEKQPKAGKQFYGKGQSVSQPQQKNKQIKDQLKEDQQKQEQKKFKYVNLIVYQKSYQAKVLQHLKEHMIKFRVQKRFDYKICAKTHIFHHNEKFDKISSMLQELKFGHERNKDKTKKAFLISVNPTVFYKISKTQVVDMNALQQQLKEKVGPGQKIQTYEFFKQKGVYLKTSSIDSALFVYFYLLDKKYEAKFKKLPAQLRTGGTNSTHSTQYNQSYESDFQNGPYNTNINQNPRLVYSHQQNGINLFYDTYTQQFGYYYNNLFYYCNPTQFYGNQSTNMSNVYNNQENYQKQSKQTTNYVPTNTNSSNYGNGNYSAHHGGFGNNGNTNNYNGNRGGGNHGNRYNSNNRR